MKHQNGMLGSGLGAGLPPVSGIQGQMIQTDSGQILINDGSQWVYASPQLSLEDQRAQDEYRRDYEYLETKHRERIEALRTLYPRGYGAHPDLDVMIDIAREDLLNPLYESVIKEFEAAQAALHRATDKLVAAVKLTDSDEIAERNKNSLEATLQAKLKLNGVYGKTRYGMTSPHNGTIPTMGSSGMVGSSGPVGPMGMPGPQGPKGDKGDPGADGVIDENLLRKLIRMVKGESK